MIRLCADHEIYVRLLLILKIIKRMSKEVVIKSDVKISRHCELNRFVDRVSTRLKHSSGLAIHNDIDIQAIPPNQEENKAFVFKPVHKSKYYLQVENEYKNRGKPDPAIARNIAARKAVEKKQLEKLERHRRMNNPIDKFHYSEVTIAADPRRIAELRHLYLVGSLPSTHVFEKESIILSEK